MTPKDKAKELVDKFQKQIFFNITNERLDIEEAKGCALIAVDEILKEESIGSLLIDWWNEVKSEIEAL